MRFGLALSVFGIASLQFAAGAVEAQEAASTDLYDRIWAHARLYTGNDSSPIQGIALSGRLQYDQAYVDEGDSSHSETNLRRFRFGARMTLRRDLVVHAEAEFDPQDGDPVYRRLTDTYVAWRPSGAVDLTLGKHSAPFTMDGQTSSKELIAVDRSNLTNNIWFTEEYMTGMSLAGERDDFVYHLGYYTSGSANRGFGNSDGGEFVLLTLGRDFAQRLGADAALLRLNLVDNQPDPANGFTRPLEHVASLNFAFANGRWGVQADVAGATGYLGQSDLFGVMLMPYYDLTPSLELVTRYTYVESDDHNGVRFARYESELVEGRGDRYEELYVGLNHYWYGHKLKLQTGLQYADMRDRAGDGGAYSGWAGTMGIRLSW
jgi:phosphate-selective porin OprO/OprP